MSPKQVPGTEAEAVECVRPVCVGRYEDVDAVAFTIGDAFENVVVDSQDEGQQFTPGEIGKFHSPTMLQWY
ncbi:hypothetical protein [Corynebacterium glyciniphilum]|uniref:hypothetical protein n=1 Tax=Corynebacterium glyciniphilum TaxID=1404244 RepID=UPI003FD0B0D8